MQIKSIPILNSAMASHGSWEKVPDPSQNLWGPPSGTKFQAPHSTCHHHPDLSAAPQTFTALSFPEAFAFACPSSWNAFPASSSDQLLLILQVSA